MNLQKLESNRDVHPYDMTTPPSLPPAIHTGRAGGQTFVGVAK